MSLSRFAKNSIEPLEARIAPANASALLPDDPSKYVKASLGGAVSVTEGQVLTTGGFNSGSYLLFVEKGNALVFFTDFNNNDKVDFNEITGISAGDGLRMVAFADIHGDIVTNLVETTVNTANGPQTVLTLSDSDSNPSNDDLQTRGDGRVLLNRTIEKIELRSLRISDLPTSQDVDADIDDVDVALRKSPSTYSIFGNIYAGAGFGATDGGLLIDSTTGINFGFELIPTIGSIKTGTAASGEFFSFGQSNLANTSGIITRFLPPREQVGGDIIKVSALDPTMKFLVNGLYAGDGGVGARGGNIVDVSLFGDDSAGYTIQAGNGGRGTTGGEGGSILNLSDFGSITGKVIVKSGDGGTGSTGAGGNGGNVEFGTFTVRGDVSILLGNGGDGFTKGGDGASFKKGIFTQPDVPVLTPGTVFGTTHLPTSGGDYVARLGTHVPADFDKDGLGDFVFTTRNTSQVVVQLGNGNQYFLSGVRNPEALTVADLNGDGQLDIAVASVDAGAQSGVVTFLGRFEHDGPGALTTSEDVNKNGINDFIDFRDGRFSTLPLNALLSLNSPTQISSIVAGDFNGDGAPELAVVATYYGDSTSTDGVTTSLLDPFQILVFLTADSEFDNLTGERYFTGQFYADLGTKRVALPDGGTVEAQPRNPYAILATPRSAGGGLAETVVIEATAISVGNAAGTPASTFDVVIAGVIGGTQGDQAAQTITYSDATRSVGPLVQLSSWGEVDSNRQPGGNNVSPTAFLMGDFTVLDYNNDGIADLSAISNSPQGFMIGMRGGTTPSLPPAPIIPLPTGAFIQDSGNGSDQSGNFYGNPGFGINTGLQAIKSADVNGDGIFNEVAILLDRGQVIAVTRVIAGPQASTVIAEVETGWLPGGELPMFGVVHTLSGTTTAPSFFVSNPGGSDLYLIADPSVILPLPIVFPLLSLGQSIVAGSGGDGLTGNGGKGGTLGGGAKVVQDPNDPTIFTYQGSLNFNVSGSFTLQAGSGGNGFANGGEGGFVSGVSIAYRDDLVGLGVHLFGGSGGRGVTGVGGNGGTIKDISVTSNLNKVGVETPILDAETIEILAGAGGVGSRGGNGGSVIGNGTTLFDAETSFLTVEAGAGGDGTKGGGVGGDINKFFPTLRRPGNLAGDATFLGFLSYIAGAGGDSVSGKGGAGGSINKSSPQLNAFINGAVLLIAGDGGAGAKGGNGGAINEFITTLAAGTQPSEFQSIAGHGGSGFSGKGGKGGSVTDVDVSSSGALNTNRILGGNGGSSAGGKGGDGGSLDNVRTTTDQGAIAFVAGGGGDGLVKGGKGGSVLNARAETGTSTLAKGLIVAGEGGDASAARFNPNDSSYPFENLFGGKIGKGGNGGSINGFTQLGNIGGHFDFFGGNGGDTLNYGTLVDSKAFVGKGGSIRNIFLAGDVGNIAPNVAIKSYNNLFAGETMVDFVENKLRNPFGGTLTDEDGNSGIVVGSAGRNRASIVDPVNFPEVFFALPAPNGQGGVLDTVVARNLMSAVAGNVDRIASIQSINAVSVPNGVAGADKGGPLPNDGEIGQLDYLDAAGNPVPTGSPVREGRLVDGAIVYKVLTNSAGLVGPRVVKL